MMGLEFLWETTLSLTLRWPEHPSSSQNPDCCLPSRLVWSLWMQMSQLIYTQKRAPHFKKDTGRLKCVPSQVAWLVANLGHGLLEKSKEDSEGPAGCLKYLQSCHMKDVINSLRVSSEGRAMTQGCKRASGRFWLRREEHTYSWCLWWFDCMEK